MSLALAGDEVIVIQKFGSVRVFSQMKKSVFDICRIYPQSHFLENIQFMQKSLGDLKSKKNEFPDSIV